jgi:hypothetical protein
MATNAEVEDADRDARLSETRRKSQLAKWNDYISFFTSKALGLGGLTVGGLDILAPHLLPITVSQPVWVAGVGLALLTGKNVIKLISSIDVALGGKE